MFFADIGTYVGDEAPKHEDEVMEEEDQLCCVMTSNGLVLAPVRDIL
jgi:hypothetical protein